MRLIYNNSYVNDWYYDTSDIIKVYRNNAIVYYKVITSGGTPEYKVCYAVVDDISQYSDREFVDVFNKADEKWYKLNNLNQYEEYGVYGDSISSGSTSRLPQGYTEVEYITAENLASGITGPYIDTNFTPNQNTRVVLDYQAIVSTQLNRRIFGSGRFNNTSSGNYIWSMENRIGQSNCYYYYKFDNGASTWSTTRLHPDLNRHTVDFNKEGKIWLDDTAVVTLPSNTVNCSYHLGLFNEINSGAETLYEYFQGRVYSCQVYDNGTLVRDLVPCTNSNNVAGMYDIVGNTFYSSARPTYQFEAGPELHTAATYYEGKLAIVDGYEYMYSGSSWINVGEVSGSTATLPDVPFVLNYNAKQYDATTHTIAMTDGQLNGTDAIAYINPNNIVDHSSDGYITISNSSMRIRKENQDIALFNRWNNSTGASMTIVCKAKTTSGENIITNRDASYNWMYRLKGNGILTLHGQSETGGINWTQSNPDILSVRTYYDGGTKVYYNNWTSSASTSPISFNYGSSNSDSSKAGALFEGYSWSNTSEQWSGDFYWVYMAQANLTDEEIQQVIDYNEGGGGQPIYPIYYDEKADPLNDLTFETMADAQAYAYNNCVYDGERATIDGELYIFNSEDENGWVEDTDHYLPDIPYSFNYNAKQYIASTYTIPQTEGQLQNVDAVCNYGYEKIVDHSADSYISVTGNSRMILSGNNGTYLNRSNTQANCPMTIISKAKTTSGYSIFTDRNSSSRQYMYRQDKTYAYLCGTGSTSLDSCICSDSIPSILSVRVYYDSGIKAKWNNWTTSASSTPEVYAYNNQSLTNGGALFCDYSNSNIEFWQGDFYWIYMSQNVLTDEQIQQVIDYNENL